MVRTKICGITSSEDAAIAVAAGADAIGVVFAPSPRRMDIASAFEVVSTLPPFVIPVGVFVDEKIELIVESCRGAGIAVAQLSGGESAADIAALKKEGLRVIKAVHITPAGERNGEEYEGADAVVLDTRAEGKSGGTGVAFDIARIHASQFDVPVILAGGLTPANVAERVRAIEPYAVDVSSGVESRPGKKAVELLNTFIHNATHADGA